MTRVERKIMTEVIIFRAIWFSASHLADWLMIKERARLLFNRAPFRLKFICFTLELRVCRLAEWHINQAFAPCPSSSSFPSSSFPRSFVFAAPTTWIAISETDPEPARSVTDISGGFVKFRNSSEAYKKVESTKRYTRTTLVEFLQKAQRFFSLFDMYR